MALYVNNNGTWKAASQPGGLRPNVKNGTAWAPCTTAWVNNNGTWKQVYQYDNTAPTSTTPTATGTSTGTSMTVNYGTVTDTESGIVSVVLYRKYYFNGAWYDGTNGISRTTIYSGAAVSSVAAGSYSDAIATSIRKVPATNKDYTVYYRLGMTDAAGNIGYTAWSAGTITKPYGTFTVTPTASAVYSLDNSAWTTAMGALVVSGYYDTGLGYQNGYFFYGAAIQNTCAGYSPDSASLYLIRSGSSGYSGSNYFCVHAHQSQPAGAPTANTTYISAGPNLTGSNAAADFTIPSGWYSLMASGTALGFVTRGGTANKSVDSTTYRQLQPISTSNDGNITITFT